MIDPGIKAQDGNAVYDSGTAADAWVKTGWGEPFRGNVWPGSCVFPDFTNAGVRSWWGGLYRDFLAMGVDGVWNDMNEPAVFNVGSKTMPLENVHRADPDLGGPDTHDRYHNIYGMQMARGTRDGLLAARPNLRPFVLSRANHLGGQRYAAAWTGDNSANWEHVAISIPMVLNLGLSGQPFAGPDIGGFAGNGDGGMFARWMGFASLLPFARGHTEKGAIDKEPWAFGPEVETTCRLALSRRYRLMPYLYTVFREAAETGLPVARPLFFADPRDASLRDVDDAFLLGKDLLVAASVKSSGSRRATRLEKEWRRLVLDPEETGITDLPALYVRPGSILCAGPFMEHDGEKPLDPLTLIVCPDADGRAEGVLYEDAGDGFGYREGAYRLVRYTATPIDGGMEIAGEVLEGNWPRAEREVRVRLLTGNAEPVTRDTDTLGEVREPNVIRVPMP
jgi:alpha-glucosidase